MEVYFQDKRVCLNIKDHGPWFCGCHFQEWFDSYLRVTYGEDTKGGWGQWETSRYCLATMGVGI